MMTYMSISVVMIDLGNLRYAAKYFPAPRFRPPVKGGVCSKHAYRGISWAALTLEVGKSPTEVTRSARAARSLGSLRRGRAQ